MARIHQDEKKQLIIDTYTQNAEHRETYLRKNRYYHNELKRFYKFNIPPGSSVLEIGCGTGQLLAALKPSHGVGIDICKAMIDKAKTQYPDLTFKVGDAEDLKIKEKFDYVILSDLIGNLLDVQHAFTELHKVCRPDTRILINYYNFLWEPVLKLGEKMSLKMPEPYQNWLPLADLRNFLYLSDFEVIKENYKMIFPVYIPLLSTFLNRLVGLIPIIKKLSLVETVIARPSGKPAYAPQEKEGYSCSVIIPCRNEKGNIENAIKRTPELGIWTEIIFIDGSSTDGTAGEVERIIKKYPDKKISLIHQGNGIGKGDAVRKGFAAAKGDVLMILDADLTVPPEDLPKFMTAITSGKGEFINGTRLVYPMEKGAMRTLNLMGNKTFSLMFTWLLEQRYRDTLCGTKVLFKKDYDRIVAGRSFFGDFDPFGDFDLIFGAAKLNLKTVEIPISYKERTYGTTNIQRFRHGWLLLKMCVVAFFKLKLRG
ncbi:MAG: glycosyltransferase [Candidatus Auribacter fodinae]|jgi:ubiquinone/menaquinone biosynthesis C-methylase UbiE/ribulose bisphosphate carboxylase small subunit|uniref:Glycosyltransferase n=1 Tax=Candidatus Auribacter fodinae TaxID=2093366 RepID=A0A3A4RAY9_9BACT|nr:MAG: glycosyltransferase [Candidatus Auribacter fodinae]